MKNQTFKIAGESVRPGSSKYIKIKVTEIYMATSLHIPVYVINGTKRGTVLTILSTLHGDELNGIEIIRQIQKLIDPRCLSGTIILVAIANPISFILQQRDLPDGKDLNRVFPGKDSSTLSSSLASKIFKNLIKPANHIIDLHSAGHRRVNLPHIRINMENRRSHRLAFLFGPELIFDSKPRKGTLRKATEQAGKGIVTFEAGEPMKFHPDSISYGVRKVKNVISGLRMYDFKRIHPNFQFIIDKHSWLKARKGGILITHVKPGAYVQKGEVVSYITEPFKDNASTIKAPYDGIIIGVSTKPHSMSGESVCHILQIDSNKKKIITKFITDDNIIKLC